ncbi:MAG: hypothetical protein IJ111_02210 [Eggerthellaceae bacterium]|nr:hypothetical protein [Eggerthellaceae bacterium]
MTSRKKEGSARRQANRSAKHAAYSRNAYPIIAAERRKDALHLLEMAGKAVLGAAVLFAVMWLACAF